MYISTSQFDISPEGRLARLQRVAGAASVSFKASPHITKIDNLFQKGSAKIRFPRSRKKDQEAVLINTAGGLTGGDRLNWDLRLGQNTQVTATTQACEKSYRSNSGMSQQVTSVSMQSGSQLFWLPQETILYDGSSQQRTLTVDIGDNCTLLAMEALVIGREAMGEEVTELRFSDRWRIRRNGRTEYADDLKIDGSYCSKAKFHYYRAAASLVFIGPEDRESLQSMVEKLRAECTTCLAGFSIVEGKITGRLLARDSYDLRQSLIPVLRLLSGSSLPRVWSV